MAPPTSSAGAPRPVVSAPKAPAAVQPPRPFELVGALLAGVPTALFSTLIAAALALPALAPKPIGAASVVVFSVIPGLGLAVFVRRWWWTLRRLGDRPAWAFLLVPFFVVVGVALGVGFAVAVSGR
jgi:hypothetical protein